MATVSPEAKPSDLISDLQKRVGSMNSGGLTAEDANMLCDSVASIFETIEHRYPGATFGSWLIPDTDAHFHRERPITMVQSNIGYRPEPLGIKTRVWQSGNTPWSAKITTSLDGKPISVVVERAGLSRRFIYPPVEQG